MKPLLPLPYHHPSLRGAFFLGTYARGKSATKQSPSWSGEANGVGDCFATRYALARNDGGPTFGK